MINDGKISFICVELCMCYYFEESKSNEEDTNNLHLTVIEISFGTITKPSAYDYFNSLEYRCLPIIKLYLRNFLTIG